jgi:hypothetical protein
MTVRGPHEIRYVYFCLSTDTKPTVGIIPNSYLFETDTNDEYIFDGANWNLYVNKINTLPEVMAQINPFVDIDTTFVYNSDKTVQQIIASGLSKTKTSLFSYNPDGTIASIGVVIT